MYLLGHIGKPLWVSQDTAWRLAQFYLSSAQHLTIMGKGEHPMSDEPKQKNYFARHKVLTVILVLIIIAIIGGASSGSKGTNGGTSSPNKSNNSSTKTYRFTERADKQSKDIELLPKESGTVDGVKLIVNDVQYNTSLSDFEKADAGKTYVLADVSLENTSDRTQPYNEFNFRIQTAGGQVLDGAITTTSGLLSSGDLVAGGKVSGKVVFQVPVESGHQYLIWKPGFGSERAIIQVK